MREKPKAIAVIGTMDTKGRELAYLARRIALAGCLARLMDIGVHGQREVPADIPLEKVAAEIGEDIHHIRSLTRGEAVAIISRAALACLVRLAESNEVHGVIGA